MDLNIVIYTVIGAGLGGMLGNFTAKLVARKSKNSESDARKVANKPYVMAPILIGTFLLPLLYKNMTLPRIIPLNLISVLSDEPEMQKMLIAMKEYEPKYYKKLVAGLDKPARNNASFEEGYKIGEQVGSQIAKDKMKYADAKVLRLGLEVAQDTFAELKTKAPRQCVNLFYERPLAIKEDTKSKKLVRAEVRLSVLLIKLPRTADTSFNSEDATITMEAIGTQLMDYTTDSDDMDPKKNAALDVHKRMCDIGAFTMGAFLKLNDDQLVNVMRQIIKS